MDRLQLVAGTAEAIPFATGLFDFLFTVNVVHHMTHVAASLLLISDAEVEAGLQKLESDLQNGPVNGLAEFICILGTMSV
jgi:hypothetical protein